ncbi:hypothetical protein ABZ917_38040 [Nonomuraea wenchangensis]
MPIVSAVSPSPAPWATRPAEQPAVRGRRDRQQAPRHDDGQGGEDDLAAARARAEAAQHRGGERADEQRSGERPLRGGRRHAERARHRRDQRRPEAADDGDDQHDDDQHDEEERRHQQAP